MMSERKYNMKKVSLQIKCVITEYCYLHFFQDSLNCCPSFDESKDSMLFAVYDGHGGMAHILKISNFLSCAIFFLLCQYGITFSL